jgi:hypothetical protein
MSALMKGIATLVGAAMVFAVSWAFIGLMARAVKELFCWGYGC